MILRQLILENFGLYAGRVEIDLAPRSADDGARPVVLVGGRNGAGKTTILEAVRLALHGKRSLGASVSKTSYTDYLRSRLHRAGDTVAPAAAVTISFDYVEAGKQHRYTVRRGWSVHGTRAVDTTDIERDGVTFAGVPRDEWDVFLQDLVPPGVAQLFFFDGEKIQEIADGDDQEGEVADAIRGLLGIELVGRLRSDLALYLARHGRAQNAALAEALETASRDIVVSEREMIKLADAAAEALTDRETRARAAEAISNRFVAEGGAVALERTRYTEERRHLDRQRDILGQDLRKLLNGHGPFLLAPKLLARLRALALADTGVDRSAVLQSLEPTIAQWRSDGLPDGWSPDQADALRAMLRAWASATGDDPANVLTTLGGRARALDTMRALDGAHGAAMTTIAAMETNSEALAAVDAALARVNSDVTDSLLGELKRAEREAGAAEEGWRQADGQLTEARGRLAGRVREHKRLLSLHEQAAAEQDRADLATRISAVLGIYEDRLLAQKVAQLSREFVRCFNELARKPGLIAGVDIDPQSFTMTLRDPVGAEVRRTSLSAGEKQIYAIALLWALARTSGRSLPVIIDTPLARLDSIHRRHLVERYFPQASQQVIVLSTDAEIDPDLLTVLEGHVSHAIQLDFDPAEKRTIVTEGFFQDSGEVRHAV